MLSVLKRATKKASRGIISALYNRYFYKHQARAYQETFQADLVSWQPDIVHCNDWQTLATGTALKNELSTTLVFDSHELETHRNPPLPRVRKKWMQRYEAANLRQCDIISTVCDPIARYLSNSYDLTLPLVIENAPLSKRATSATLSERWGRTPKPGTSLRSDCGYSDDDMVVVIVGNATVNRGIETSLVALAMLPEKVKIAIVGKATQKFTEMLEMQIFRLGLEKRVKMLEPVHPLAVVGYIESADIGLIPLVPMTLSYELALPNKLFECAFANLPLIASDTFEMKRVIEEHGLGETFQAGNPKDLAKVMSGYLEIHEEPHRYFYDNTDFENRFAFDKSIEKLFIALQRFG